MFNYQIDRDPFFQMLARRVASSVDIMTRKIKTDAYSGIKIPPDNYFHSERCSSKRYAHLRNCTEYVLTKETIMELKTQINTTRHRYLNDHIFQGDCFVPATMIIEIFVEAGTWFSEFTCDGSKNEKQVIAIENLNIQRALAVKPGGSLDVSIILNKVDKEENTIRMRMEIVSKRINRSGKIVGKRLNARVDVILSDLSPEPIAVPRIFDEYRYYYFSPKEYYSFYFPSLGPVFQSQTGRFAIDGKKNYLIGEYNCQNREKDFIHGQSSQFLISPLGYDSCLQYAVFLSRVKTLIGRLPVRAKRIHICKPHPLTGAVKVLVRCLHIDGENMACDFWAFQENGPVIIKGETFVVQRSPFNRYGDRQAFDTFMEKNQVAKLDW